MGQKSHADTSWLIALFDDQDSHHSKALRELEELTSAPSISAIALAELLVNFESSEAIDFSATYNSLKSSVSSVIAMNENIAVKAAEIRSKNKVTLGDAVVIASALSDRAQLLTFDKNMRTVYERVK